jgi:DNA-directed RNA polymerase I, II, and III subunit RPABC2
MNVGEQAEEESNVDSKLPTFPNISEPVINTVSFKPKKTVIKIKKPTPSSKLEDVTDSITLPDNEEKSAMLKTVEMPEEDTSGEYSDESDHDIYKDQTDKEEGESEQTEDATEDATAEEEDAGESEPEEEGESKPEEEEGESEPEEEEGESEPEEDAGESEPEEDKPEDNEGVEEHKNMVLDNLQETNILDDNIVEPNDDNEYLHQFDEQLKTKLLVDYHPESQFSNYDEIAALSVVTRNDNNIIVDELHKTMPILTKYERTRILGVRTKQLNDGATPYIEVSNKVLDSYLIAIDELEQKKLPYIIRRPLPNHGSEYWKLADLELISF